MSFSTQICLTNTGTTQLGPTLYFYSDVTGYQGSFGSDSTDNLVGNNCPYTMENVPDGTTIVRIIDPITNCCVDITLQSNDLCNVYNLNFDVYETQTVSQIVAGNLVGETVSNISDYIINWYGPGEGSTELAFTSGYGTAFTDIGWDLTHPLTGNSSPIVEAGVYTPVIDRVVIDGNTFSLTGSPNTYVANLDCFTSALVTVDAIKCDNGNLPAGSIYSHLFQFNNVSVGNPPLGLSASFELSSSTNYIAWQFKGYSIYDTLKMTFYGSEYGYEPLIIENVKVGDGAGEINISVGTNPKILPYNEFVRKVTCLTAFTVNEGDYVTINITPNNVYNNTIWDFNLKCLDSFDCTTCFDQYENSLGKIYSASTYGTLLTCNRVRITTPFNLCSQNDFNQTDIGKYWQRPSQNTLNSSIWWTQIIELYVNSTNCNQGTVNFSLSPSCAEPTNNSYTFTKEITENGEGLILFTFDSIDDLNHYYNDYQSMISSLQGGFDNTQLNYYKYFELYIPNNSNPNQECGDTTPYVRYFIHHSTQVTTGGTGPYTMTMTMPTIVDNINFTDCEIDCNYRVNQFVQIINSSSLGLQNNIEMITNTSSKYLNPICNGRYIFTNTFTLTQGVPVAYLQSYWTFENDTYVYSGNNILVSSLTGRTCEIKGVPANQPAEYGNRYTVYSHNYKVQLTDENNLLSFQILAPTVSNYIIGSYTNTAMTVVNNVVTYANPDYCI